MSLFQPSASGESGGGGTFFPGLGPLFGFIGGLTDPGRTARSALLDEIRALGLDPESFLGPGTPGPDPRIPQPGDVVSAIPGTPGPTPAPGPPSPPPGAGTTQFLIRILRLLCANGILPPSVCEGVLPRSAPVPRDPGVTINIGGLPGTVGALPVSAHAELLARVRLAGETVAAFGGQGATTLAPAPCPPEDFTARLHSMLAECPTRCVCHGG